MRSWDGRLFARHDGGLIDGFEDSAQGEDQGSLRVPAIPLTHDSLHLVSFRQNRTTAKKAREVVAGEFCEKGGRHVHHHAFFVDLQDHAHARVDRLVGDVVRETCISGEEIGGHRSRLHSAPYCSIAPTIDSGLTTAYHRAGHEDYSGCDAPGFLEVLSVSLSVGIVGLPNVGKSTLFHALTRQRVPASNYPFCTIDPNVGIVPVPDHRLDRINEIVRPEKLVPATVEFVDIAGLVKGASHGEGLGNQFLAHIRECDAVCEVLRAFGDPDVAHVEGRVDPASDADTVLTELILADMATVEKVRQRLRKQAQSAREFRPLLEAVEEVAEALDAGKPAREAGIDEQRLPLLRDLHLLTLKPLIYVLNVDEDHLADAGTGGVGGGEVIPICAKLESELADLEPMEREEFLAAMGMERSGLERLVWSCYRLLGLITFFTAQPNEARAWTVRQGTKAPQAAGVIHSDFERGFIKAEVVDFDTLHELGSEAAVKAAGRMRIEGKDYVVRDGDIIHFRFNV